MTRAPAIEHLVQQVSLLVRGQAPKLACPAVKRLAPVIAGRRFTEAEEAATGVRVMIDPGVDLLPANGASLARGRRRVFRRRRRWRRPLPSPRPGVAEGPLESASRLS